MPFWSFSRTERSVTRRWRWLRRGAILVSGLGLAGLVGLAGLALVIACYGQTDRARPADVIIVLGGGSPGTERRARHAAALYARGIAPALLCSGGYRPVPEAPTEAERCAQTAQEAGVPESALWLEPDSLSTQANAEAAAALMAAQGWRSAVLVSDDFHLWRAAWRFRRAGVTVRTSPAQATQDRLPFPEWAQSLLREVAAALWTAWDDGRDWVTG